jgi:hypothetical protein
VIIGFCEPSELIRLIQTGERRLIVRLPAGQNQNVEVDQKLIVKFSSWSGLAGM